MQPADAYERVVLNSACGACLNADALSALLKCCRASASVEVRPRHRALPARTPAHLRAARAGE